MRKQFEAAWEGYLRAEKEHTGPNPGFQPSQRHNPQETAKNDASETSQTGVDVTAGNAEKPQFPNGCDVVTARNGEKGWSAKI